MWYLGQCWIQRLPVLVPESSKGGLLEREDGNLAFSGDNNVS